VGLRPLQVVCELRIEGFRFGVFCGDVVEFKLLDTEPDNFVEDVESEGVQFNVWGT
jgi:hypothetical protein